MSGGGTAGSAVDPRAGDPHDEPAVEPAIATGDRLVPFVVTEICEAHAPIVVRHAPEN